MKNIPQISEEYLQYVHNFKKWSINAKYAKQYINVFECFVKEKVPSHLKHTFNDFNNKTEDHKLNILYKVAEYNARVYGVDDNFTQRAKIDMLYQEYIKIATQ